MLESVVLFGGTGFIGTHLTQHLLRTEAARTIYLVDLKAPRDAVYGKELQAGLRTGRVVFIPHDLRQPVPVSLLPATVGLAFNLAAVHREPGHAPREYFETNLLGAEHFCAWAALAHCTTVVFTSSISPYGPSEDRKTESSLPVPETPYGSSKLSAEKIHLGWQSAVPNRRLLILRPGVVFGPGEGGNVSRLVRSLVKGYFVYLGNRNTIKAAGYVKELCLVASFGLEILSQNGPPVLLLNFTLDPPPTLEQMVAAILSATGRKRRPLNLPRSLLLAVSYPFAFIERVSGIALPINPVRVRKLFRSNNIVADQLRSLGYRYNYSLESAFADWAQDNPADFAD